jgi:hypothetical protein
VISKISRFSFISQGVRIVQIKNPQNLLAILDYEIDYLENCVDNPFGEFSETSAAAAFQHILAFLLSAGLISSYRISSLNASQIGHTT